MCEQKLEKTTARFPFRSVKRKGQSGPIFRKERLRDGSGLVVELRHNGHDHITIDYRSVEKKPGARPSNKRILADTMDAKEAVQFASVLLHMAEHNLRDSAEMPYIQIITSNEHEGFGQNWLRMHHETAMERMERRKSRSHLYGLMRQVVETCTNDDFLVVLLSLMADWAERNGDQFALQQAEKAAAQMGLIDKSSLN